MKRNLISQCLSIAKKHNNTHPNKNSWHHFCFIIQDNKLIEWGFNRRGKPLNGHGYMPHQMVHAENDAYKKAKGIMDKRESFEIINIRLNRRGELRNSFPCKCCMSYLKFFGCNKIWFTTNVGFAKMEI